MSTPTLDDLRTADPAAFRAAAGRWRALSTELDAAYEQFRSAQRLVAAAGSGAAITAAIGRLLAQAHQLSELAQPARRLAQTLDAHADELTPLRRHADAVRAAAEAVLGGGDAGPALAGATRAPVGVDRVRAALAREVAELLARAAGLDQATSLGIRSAVPGPRVPSPDRPAPERPGPERPGPEQLGRDVVRRQTGRAPAEVFAWWRDLTPRQRDWVLAAHADLVGGLDGIPVADRDRANRRYLDQLLMQAAPPAALVRLHDRLAVTEEAYLLLVDPAGDGRLVVTLGNPDQARHTAVYVPGVGTDLDDIDAAMSRAAQLRRAADATTIQPGDVAVVYWLGYDPPDGLLDGWREGPARRGGAALAPFLDGLRATHEPTALGHHVTTLGYSYGSTVVAEAARGPGLAADDIVVVGSPGLHSDQARELHPDPRHVWVGRADGDEIRFVPGPVHGPEPADPGYGANRFTTDTTGHGGYWRPGSDSLLNQAYIVTAQYLRVTLEHGSPPA